MPVRVDPILRWVGGKRRLVPRLLRALPPQADGLRYNEPFLGAGSLFLAMQPSVAQLSDANEHLMSCYAAIREQPDQVYEYLRKHAARHSKEHYYAVRERYNRLRGHNRFIPSAAQAARFVYLNKTCFNGIFRVNLKGEFNVPYGGKVSPLLPSRQELGRVSVLLERAQLRAGGFEEALETVGKGDFVYLDPPYPPINGTSYFTHYTADRFGEEDQKRLARFVRAAAIRGACIMMSNADTPFIRKLYKDFFIVPLSVTRYVTCKSVKHAADEVLVTNYNVRPSCDD